MPGRSPGTPTFALVAGGGTAGHVLPGLAVARALVARGHDPATIHFVGSERGLETTLVPEAGFGLTVHPGRGIQRRFTLANLAAVWANFEAAGARYVVVAAVIDSVSLREMYAEHLAGCEVQLVGLTADDDTVRSRLQHRDTGQDLERHLRALKEHRPTASVADFTVANDRSAADVAAEILGRAGWADQVT